MPSPRWQHDLSRHALAAGVAALAHEGLARERLHHLEHDLSVRASLTLLAGQWLLQLIAALVCLGAAQLIAKKTGTRWIFLVGYSLGLFALLTFPVAASLASGEWISQQSYASAVRWLAPALATLFAAAAWTLLFSPYLVARRWWHLGTCVLLSGLALSLSWINVTFLTGQYEPAHRLLMVLAALCSQWGLAQLIGGLLAPPPRAVRFILVTAGAWTMASFWLVRAPVAVVAELLFKSPRATTWVTYVAPTHQANPIHDALVHLGPEEAQDAQGEQTAETGWELPADWNVILLVIDTLRADPFISGAGQHPKRRFRESDAPFLNDLFSRSFTFRQAYAGGNMTHISMPSMLRSRSAFDEHHREGAGVATRVARLGRHSIAVAPSGLATRHLSWRAPSLLDDFEEVHTYFRGRHNEIRELISQALESGKKRPFFAWIHYMSMHAPGWAEHSLARSKGSHQRKYVQSLRWTDGEIAKLFAELEKQGLAQKTAVIVTADHGEGLGDKGVQFHAGPALHEEVIRVPLAIYIPGRTGRLVSATVGNVDILPTIVELFGGNPSSPSMHGTSLVPLLANAQAHTASYYVQSYGAERLAAVRDGRKYVLDVGSGAWAHYNLKADRWGARPRFDPTIAEHRAMADQLTWLNPELFAADLANGSTDALLDQRLAEGLPNIASQRSRFLLDLVRLDPTPQRLAWAKRAFAQAQTDALRLQVLDHVYAADPAGFGPLLEAHMASLMRTPRERAFVEKLGDIKQERFAPSLIAGRLLELAKEPPTAWAEWLRLIASWPLPPSFTPALAQMLTQLVAQPEADRGLLIDLLHAVAHLESSQASTASLQSLCRHLGEHKDPGVRGEAALAIANLGGADAEALLRRLLEQGPRSVSVAALRGLMRLKGAAVLSDIEQFGRLPGNTLHALHLLDELDSPKGVPVLDRMIAQLRGSVADEAKALRSRLRAKN